MLPFRNLCRNQVLFDGIGTNPVVNLGEFPLCRPANEFLLFFLEALEFTDEVYFEFRADPHGKLKGDVLVGICSTISASLGNNADGMGFFRPFLGAKPEIVETRLAFNYVEFGRIKIGVVHLLPCSQELYGIPVAEPVMEKELTILRAHHIGERMM